MRVRYGMVHGRFQPFHTGHLSYTLEAFNRSEHLIIGITNPDPSETRVEAADAQRHTSEANPFTFFERQWMIRAALVEAAIDLSRISIVPFPIHAPGALGVLLPQGDRAVYPRILRVRGQGESRPPPSGRMAGRSP